MINKDLFFLKQTLKLAKKGEGMTNPNPMVGCVIVKDGHVIAEGFHRKIGQAHAEVEALRSALTDLRGSTLYVNLEPCNHFNRTPPCAQAILQTGIKRVVCPFIDPNPKVHGAGITALRSAGIQVDTGLLQKESRSINEAYFTFHEKKRPFIVLKFASSLDGKIAAGSGESKWITNEKSRQYAGKLRNDYQSVLVGINTILRDDPHLGSKIKDMTDPLRIIADSTLKIPLESKVLRDKNVLIATTLRAGNSKKDLLRKKGIEFISCGDKKVSLQLLLRELVSREVISVLVEGGGSIIGSFVDEKLFDKVYAFHAPMIIGGRNTVSAVEGNGAATMADAIRLRDVTFKKLGDCSLTIGYPDLS